MKNKRYRISRGDESYLCYGNSRDDAISSLYISLGIPIRFIKKHFQITRLGDAVNHTCEDPDVIDERSISNFEEDSQT